MKLITRDTDYAIRALIVIAQSDKKIISVSDLVKEIDVPKPFLRKILQVLNKSKLLKSYKGKQGGFQLKKSPSKIFVLDLMGIFQGRFALNECVFKKQVCPDIKVCRLKKRVDNIQKYVMSQLSGISLQSLYRKE